MRRSWRGGRGQRRLARTLRDAPTAAEAALWMAFMQASLSARVRRQHPVAGYIVDFYVPAFALVVEVDGGVHDDSVERDAQRTAHLEARGLRVLRFTNDEVLRDPIAIVERVRQLGSW